MEPRVDVLEHRPLSAHRKKSYEHPRALAQPLLSWQTPQELVFVVLRHSPSSPLLPPGSRPHRPLPSGCVSSRNFLLMASSSLSELALPIKLSSSISRINAVRRRRVRAMFLAVSTHQEGRDVYHLTTSLLLALVSLNIHTDSFHALRAQHCFTILLAIHLPKLRYAALLAEIHEQERFGSHAIGAPPNSNFDSSGSKLSFGIPVTSSAPVVRLRECSNFSPRVIFACSWEPQLPILPPVSRCGCCGHRFTRTDRCLCVTPF